VKKAALGTGVSSCCTASERSEQESGDMSAKGEESPAPYVSTEPE
jgi:hypothetical protein